MKEIQHHNDQVIIHQSYKLTQGDVKNLVGAGVIPKNTPIPQIKIFAEVCKAKGLSPFSKEIYLVGYGGRYSVITGVDGLRKMASRTGEYAGKEDAQYNRKADGSYQTTYDVGNATNIRTCTITVYRMVQSNRVPFTATVVFKEFNSGKQKWASMPFQMIAKVAECFALKQAFADELSGVHSDSENAAFNNTQSKGKSLN